MSDQAMGSETVRDPRSEILFEPMAIGPVMAKNRIYQVSHCNGGGYRDPSAAAEIAADRVVFVTSRIGNDQVWQNFKSCEVAWTDAGIASVAVLGDAQAPAPIAWATYAEHRYVRELDEPDIGDALPFRREITHLAST